MKGALNHDVGRLFVLATLFAMLLLPVAIPLRAPVLPGATGALIFLEAGELRPLGFRQPGRRSMLLRSLGLPPAIVALGTFVRAQVERLTGIRSDLSAYGVLEGNVSTAVLALTGAAFGEGNRQRRMATAISRFAFGLAYWCRGRSASWRPDWSGCCWPGRGAEMIGTCGR